MMQIVLHYLNQLMELVLNDDVVFGVIIGTGVGGGLIINNKIVNGFNNITGEWGHNQMPIGTNDKWKRQLLLW